MVKFKPFYNKQVNHETQLTNFNLFRLHLKNKKKLEKRYNGPKFKNST